MQKTHPVVATHPRKETKGAKPLLNCTLGKTSHTSAQTLESASLHTSMSLSHSPSPSLIFCGYLSLSGPEQSIGGHREREERDVAFLRHSNS